MLALYVIQSTTAVAVVRIGRRGDEADDEPHGMSDSRDIGDSVHDGDKGKGFDI